MRMLDTVPASNGDGQWVSTEWRSVHIKKASGSKNASWMKWLRPPAHKCVRMAWDPLWSDLLNRKHVGEGTGLSGGLEGSAVLPPKWEQWLREIHAEVKNLCSAGTQVRAKPTTCLIAATRCRWQFLWWMTFNSRKADGCGYRPNQGSTTDTRSATE